MKGEVYVKLLIEKKLVIAKMFAYVLTRVQQCQNLTKKSLKLRRNPC